MQGIWSTLLAILVYLGTMAGVVPAAGTGAGYYPPATGLPGGSATRSPAYAGGREIMAYYAKRRADDDLPYQALNRATGMLTTVIPQAYRIDGSGRISGAPDRRAYALARARGLKVVALVQNTGNSGFDAGAVHALLADPMARARAVNGLYNLVIQYGLDGVNLDLENVPPGDRDRLTSFIRELAARLRPGRFLFAASLPAKIRDERGSSWSGAYDYHAIGPYLDQAVIMAYDEHVPGGAPGPVASLGWVDAVLRYAVTAFPRQKLVLGLPAYGYVFSARGSWAVNHAQAVSLAARAGASPAWDYRAQVPFFVYTGQGIRHTVYYEDNRSVALKAGLAARYGLRGVAVWRLGYEDPGLWRAIAAKLSA
ncbi:MAG: glycosyl hydrolase family 18 protein [Patescibacteria group bacterium]